MLNIAVQILHQAKSHHHPHRSAQKRHVESEANNVMQRIHHNKITTHPFDFFLYILLLNTTASP